MIPTSFFKTLKDDHDAYRSKRHELIKESSDILKEAKRTIFSVHRDNLDEAARHLAEAEKHIAHIETEVKNEPNLRHEGAYKAALEEYIEAYLLLTFLKEKKIHIPDILEFHYEEYLGGLCDFTGELVRKAVLSVTQGKTKEITLFHDAGSGIIEQLIELDMTGSLRSKFDDAKRNLKRLEEILYDIKVNLSSRDE